MMGRLFEYLMLYLTGAALTVLSVVAIPIARTGSVSVSAVTGAAAGSTLLVAATISLAASAPPTLDASPSTARPTLTRLHP